MFDRLAALAHLLRMLVEPALNGFEVAEGRRAAPRQGSRYNKFT
jgi:hypothetical protein